MHNSASLNNFVKYNQQINVSVNENFPFHWYYWYFYAPRWRSGAYCFCPVCLSVCLCVRNFNLAYNFFVSQGSLIKLHTLVHHHESYILTKGRNSKIHFDRIMPLFRLRQLRAKALVLSQGAAGGICGVSQTQPSCLNFLWLNFYIHDGFMTSQDRIIKELFMTKIYQLILCDHLISMLEE